MRRLLVLVILFGCLSSLVVSSSQRPYLSRRVSKVVRLTLYAEDAKNDAGRFGIFHVIKNRAYLSGETLERICLAPNQFSCWNKYKGSRKRISPSRSIPKYHVAFPSVTLSDQMERIRDYATHYHNPKKASPKHYNSPDRIYLGKIGEHVFYCFQEEYDRLTALKEKYRNYNS